MRGSMGNLTHSSKIAIKGKKYYVVIRVSLESNITLMTVGNINISRNIIDCFKISQRRFEIKEMRITHS